MPTPITHVSDTARWVAMYRAMETERPDALFRDPYARRLAGESGEAILRAMPQGRRWAWPMIVRTAVMDELILRAVARDGVDTVLNLAAGLDARPYRLALPAELCWVDADLDGILSYKETELRGERARCRIEFAKTDLTDAAARRALFARVGASARRALVIAGNAPMLFAPAEGTRFFEPHGWGEAEYRPIMDEAVRLKRAPRMTWLWRLLARLAPKARREEFTRFSGIVLLKRQP